MFKFLIVYIKKEVYLTKTESITKKSLIELSSYCFEERYYFCRKIADISKIKRALEVKGTFSVTKYMCVLMYQISSSLHNSNEVYTGSVILIKLHLKTNP